MTYSATIQKQVTASYTSCPTLPAILQMSVQSVVGFLDLGLFVYRIDPDTGSEAFSHVATACDLQDYLYNGTSGTFVRRASMSKTYFDASAANAGIAEIELAIQSLCSIMEQISVLSAPTTVTISS